MKKFTQANVEEWLHEFIEENPLTCANAEKFNVMCMTMKNLGFMNREFTEEDAKEWVASMSPPARWTIEQTTAVMNQRGYHQKPCEFWAVMNMLFSDYGATMTKYGMDRLEIWADLAYDWLNDHDAEFDKPGRYWRDIVKH